MNRTEPIVESMPPRPRAYPKTIAALLPAVFALATCAATPSPQPPQPEPGTTPAPGASNPAPVVPTQVGTPAQPVPDGPQPAVAVVGEQAFDFGRVWPGDGLKHAFTLKNTGKAELAILKVQPG